MPLSRLCLLLQHPLQLNNDLDTCFVHLSQVFHMYHHDRPDIRYHIVDIHECLFVFKIHRDGDQETAI